MMMTTVQVAKTLGIAKITARVWCYKGLFPNAVKIGRDWLILEEDVKNVVRPLIGNPRHREAKQRKD